MRFIIVTLGSEGDIRPFFPLALELKDAGHEVSIATFDFYSRLISSYGIDFVKMGFVIPMRTKVSNNLFIRSLRSTVVNCPGFLEELWEVCQGADVIIYNVATFPCFYVAEKLQIPCFAVFGQPHHPTRAFPDPSVTGGRPLGGIFNILEYHLFDLVHWLYIRTSINRWRTKVLGLPPIPVFKTVVRQIEQRRLPILYNYSPSVTPKPKEWRKEGIQITGYWFLNGKKDQDIPQDIANFLMNGEPPVFISAMWNIRLFTTSALLQIQEALGARLIIQDLYSEIKDMPASEHILYIKGGIPHEWLFKGISVAVHHGGLGICMNCIRAGVPMVMIPSDLEGNDHRFWAHQITAAGAGLRCFYKKDKFVRHLVQDIKKVLADSRMKQRTLALSNKLSQEKGVENAIGYILGQLRVNPVAATLSF